MNAKHLALLLVVSAGCRSGTSSSASASASASASSLPASAADEPIAVPQRPMQAAPMLFHPTLPIVAQIDGELCQVWDIDVGVRRGSIPRADCERFRPAQRSVPEKIQKGTPIGASAQNTSPDDPPQENVGQLVAAWSADGKTIATGRKGSAEVSLWDAASGALSFSLRLPTGSGAEPARLEDLAWTPHGKLAAAALPGGAFVWDLSRTGDGPKAIETAMVRYQHVWLDPAGRYLGGSGTMTAQKSIGLLTSVVSLVDGNEKLANRSTLAGKASLSGGRTSAVWAPDGNVVFALQSYPLQAEVCEDESLWVTAIDLRQGSVKRHGFDRALLHVASVSPDGRSLLLSVTKLGECKEEAPGGHASKETVTELWSIEGESKVSWSAPVESKIVRWSASGDSVAFGIGKNLEVRSTKGGKRLPSAAAGEEDTTAYGDPTGRFELVAGPLVRRLRDGEVLHFDERGGAFTERYAFSKSPPDDWVFRMGSDVLRGKLVRANEAPFLTKTPDLVTRFVSGTVLPSMKREDGR